MPQLLKHDLCSTNVYPLIINLQKRNYVLLTTAFISVIQLAIIFGIKSMSG